MATWHQMRRPVRLYHDTKWTVVDDPPNNGRSLMLFSSETEAQAYVRRRVALGTGEHCYVLQPAIGYWRGLLHAASQGN